MVVIYWDTELYLTLMQLYSFIQKNTEIKFRIEALGHSRVQYLIKIYAPCYQCIIIWDKKLTLSNEGRLQVPY